MSAVCLPVLLSAAALCLSVVIRLWVGGWEKGGGVRGGGGGFGVVGSFSGHHQWGRRSPCCNMTGSQATRRHRSLVSNLLRRERDQSELLERFLLLVACCCCCLNRKLSLKKLSPCFFPTLLALLCPFRITVGKKENSCLCFLPPSVGYLPVTLSLYVVFLSRSLSAES